MHKKTIPNLLYKSFSSKSEQIFNLLEILLLWYNFIMTDINKVIMEKAQGGVKLNPDEQRRFLGTFEERVLASCSIEQANETLIRSHFKEMLSSIIKKLSTCNSQNFPRSRVRQSNLLSKNLQGTGLRGYYCLKRLPVFSFWSDCP